MTKKSDKNKMFQVFLKDFFHDKSNALFNFLLRNHKRLKQRGTKEKLKKTTDSQISYQKAFDATG